MLDYKFALKNLLKEELKGNNPVPDLLSFLHIEKLYSDNLDEIINEYLEKKSEFSFYDLIKNNNSLLELICSFIAMLEMVKLKSIKIFQNKLYGDIRVRKMDNE